MGQALDTMQRRNYSPGDSTQGPMPPAILAVHDTSGSVTKQVARLRSLGFAALPLPNLAYRCADGLFLYRFDHGVLDIVTIRAFDAAVAIRVRDQFDPDNPVPTFNADQADPEGVIWYSHGKAKTVVDQLHRDLYSHYIPTVSGFSGQLDLPTQSRG